MKRVANKIALITGAARGIGESTARLLHHEGATVILTDVLDDMGQKVAASLGANAYYYHLNVAKDEDWQALVAHIEKQFGHIDILFNNAGITGVDENSGPQDPEFASLESWHYVHHVNLDGVFFGCKYGIKLMKKRGGSIINMSSRSALIGVPGAAAYASSKAAIRNHSKSVALYCAEKQYHIRCNTVLPGAILTPLWNSMLGDTEESRNAAISTIAAGIPVGHMGEPIDVANAVLYLASDESTYLTGSEIVLDGGILAGSAASYKK